MTVTDETYQQELAELEAKIRTLPGDRQAALVSLLQETQHRHAQIRQAIRTARDALDDWRLAMKYMLFDQEARCRESMQ